MTASDLRPCPFFAHDKPDVERVPGESLAYVVSCPKGDAMGPHCLDRHRRIQKKNPRK